MPPISLIRVFHLSSLLSQLASCFIAMFETFREEEPFMLKYKKLVFLTCSRSVCTRILAQNIIALLTQLNQVSQLDIKREFAFN